MVMGAAEWRQRVSAKMSKASKMLVLTKTGNVGILSCRGQDAHPSRP